MQTILPSQKVYLGKSTIPHAGRGIFTSRDILAGEVIEICPIIEIPTSEIELLKKTLLINYYFVWGKAEEKRAICLGFGSLYNHAYEPNATYMKHLESETIHFNAIKDIKKDEEITVNYNYGNPSDKSPLWIKDIPQSG